MRHLFVLLFFAITGCSSCKGTSTPAGGTDCAAACANMRLLQCHGVVNGDKSPDGKDCEVWRCNTPDDPGHTSCVAHAKSCDEAVACLHPVKAAP